MADTLTKVLEESNQKLKQAEALESKAVAKERSATALRDDADRQLTQVRNERATFDALNTAKEAEFRKREDNLKNREAALIAGQADLARKTAETEKEFEARENEITRSEAELQKLVTHNREEKARLDNRAEKYKSISEYINNTL